jgi:hypothetical protein
MSWAKIFVLWATENTGADPVLSLEACEWLGPPDTPICGHTDKEQALAPFPEISQKQTNA